MPSKVRHWFSKHGNLALLNITSDDPRRDGVIDVAMIDAGMVPVLEMYSWRIRHGQIENDKGKSLLGFVAAVFKRGSIQKEVNCDFTSSNLRKRSGPAVCNGALDAFKAANPDWRTLVVAARTKVEMHPKMKWRTREEWVALPIVTNEGGLVHVKVNKWLAHVVPMRAIFLPKTSCALFMPPTPAQNRRGRRELRRGASLQALILDAVGVDEDVVQGRLRDVLDLRVDANGRFLAAVEPKNKWHHTSKGMVLEVYYPECACKWEWVDTPSHVTGGKHIPAFAERRAYYLVDETTADVAQDYRWTVLDYDAVSMNFEYDKITARQIKLYRLVCDLHGLGAGPSTIPARYSKYYAKAVQEDNYELRARLENLTSDEQRGAGRMFVKERHRKYRRIHADKTEFIEELGVHAHDLRPQSIRVGGSK